MTNRPSENREPGPFVVEVTRLPFDDGGVRELETRLFGKLSWPLVYVLSDASRAYVGETASVALRMRAHLAHADKQSLEQLRVVTSPAFNKSAALHFEAKLISYLLGEGRLRLLNGNGGLTGHTYYQQARYERLFEDLWERLRGEELVERSLREIDNSDLFKYSPYKSLSLDQIDVVAKVVGLLTQRDEGAIVVRGAAGTGKTVLAIFLMKLLASSLGELLPPDRAGGADGRLDDSALRELKVKYPQPRIGLVVAMTSLRNTLKAVFREVYGLSPKQVISPAEASRAEELYDVLFVDESHRLRQRRAIGWMGAYDRANRRLGFGDDATELDWVLAKSRHTILFYDEAQSVKASDVDAAQFAELLADSPAFDLQTQHRSRGGVAFTDFVRDLLDDRWQRRNRFEPRADFELLFFDEFADMVSRIKTRDEEVGLSRLIAGYAWEWRSKKDPSAIDIVIDGVELQWNMVADNWINSPNAVNEVGCIHTTQGYDLNYAGVIFGPEIGYDPDAGRIVVYRDRYLDAMGKQGVHDDELLSAYVRQIYYTILCRGMRGTYVYVCDPDLREHLRSFFPPAPKVLSSDKFRLEVAISDLRILQRDEVIPFVDAVPYYDIAVAAGEFSAAQEAEEPRGWIRLGARVSPSRDLFACRVYGESMNRRIPSGSVCLFRQDVTGSRQGKIVIASHRRFDEAEFGAGLTVKEYTSEKTVDPSGGWQHARVVLSPKSTDPDFVPIVLEESAADELKVLAEFVSVIR